MEAILVNTVRNWRKHGVSGLMATEELPRLMTPEDAQKYRVERETAETEYRRRETACAVAAVAEQLVVTHNEEPSSAFETAMDLHLRITKFVETFQLPQGN